MDTILYGRDNLIKSYQIVLNYLSIHLSSKVPGAEVLQEYDIFISTLARYQVPWSQLYDTDMMIRMMDPMTNDIHTTFAPVPKKLLIKSRVW